MQNIRVASVQFNHLPNNKRSNLEKIQYWVKKAHNEKVRLAVFPEMCITGYWHVRKLAKKDILALSEEVPDGPSAQELVQLSRKYGMSIGAGLIEQSDDGKLYNTYVVAMPDGQTKKHRKLHCFISEHIASGDSFTVFETPEGCCVGVLICYDCNIIENVRINALKGAEILLAPHQTGGCNSPSPRLMGLIDTKLWENRTQNPKAIEEEFLGPKGREWLMRWLPSRAHDNGIFLIFSNGVGIDDDEVRSGISVRREGAYYGVVALFNRLSGAINLIVIATVFSGTGWGDWEFRDETLAPITLRFLVVIWPVIILIIALILLKYWPIHGDRLQENKRLQEQLHSE